MAERRTRRPRTGEARFAAYLDGIASVLGHASRAASARAYRTGLPLPGERKSIEPMAARLAPAQVQAKHQSLHHVVAKAAWDDAAVLRAVRGYALPAIARHGPVRHWIIDDTGLPKQGRHSVGVARQHCGALGKRDDCQVAVSLPAANEHASLPIACRLHLPEAWAADAERRAKAGVPEEVGFATKPAIALGQLRRALEEGVPVGTVLGDAGCGDECDFRVGVAALDLRHVLGIRPGTGVRPPGQAPLPPQAVVRPGAATDAVAAQPGASAGLGQGALAQSLSQRAWRTVPWREGSRAALTSRFAAVRVRPAHRDTLRTGPWPEEWPLIEWPEGAAEPSRHWLSDLPPRSALRDLVHAAKARWAIERDHQEPKQEIGPGHHEGRGWRGFHHHASLCIAACGFLVAERRLFPPRSRLTRRRLAAPAPPRGFRPRGAALPA